MILHNSNFLFSVAIAGLGAIAYGWQWFFRFASEVGDLLEIRDEAAEGGNS